jgi:hypothetical protein
MVSDAAFGGLVIFALYTLIAVFMLVTASRMSQRKLKPSLLVGIRTASTMSSPHAWYVGHQAAAPQMRWVALAFAVSGMACGVSSIAGAPEGVIVGLVIAGSAVAVILLFKASVIAKRAIQNDTQPP